MYRFFRSLIKEFTQGLKEGVTNLYNYSQMMNTKFHSSMDLIATDALYVKNSLATMVEPIVNAVGPVIDMLADRFAALAATVAEFISALTGETVYTKALKFPTEWGEAAEEAATATQKWLGPFDEINRLNAPHAARIGEGLDFEQMFETVEVQSEGFLSRLAEMIKSAIESGDFSGVGSTLATKLKTALDNIPWDKIKKSAKKIGSSIGTFITGFFTEQGFTSSVGTAIAEGLNTGITFFGTLADTLDFAGLGNALGEGISSFLENFDYEGAIGTAVKWATGFVTFLSNAVKKVDWSDVGKKIGEAIKTIDWKKAFNSVGDLGSTVINSLIDFLSGFNNTGALGDVLDSLGESVAGFIKSIKWKEAFETVGGIGVTVIKALFNAIVELTSGKDNVIVQAAEGFGKFVGDVLKDKYLWKRCFEAVGGLGKALVQGLFAAVTGVIEGITGEDLNFTVSDETAKDIFQALFAGVTISKIFSWIMLKGGGSGGGGGSGLGVGAGLAGGFGLAKVLTLLATMTSGDGARGEYDDMPEFQTWKESLTSYDWSRLAGLNEGWDKSAYGGLSAIESAFLAMQSGLADSFDDWYEQMGFGPGAHDAGTLSEAQEAIQQFTIAGQALGEAFAPVGQVVGGVFDTIKTSITGADKEQKTLAKHAPQMKAALERSAKGMGRASEDIDRHASATRKKFNLMEKGLDNIKKKTTAKDALGQSKFEKASKNIRESSKAAAKRIGEIGTGVKSLKTRLVTKDALGQSKFESAAKNIRESSKATTKRVGEIGTKTDAIKKKMGKNPLGHTEFETSANNIKTAANGVGTSIDNIGTKADTTKTTLKGKMAEMVTDAGEFKTNAMGKFNEFSSGLTHGMELSMSDFVDEGNHGLDTMLRNYSKFTSETARLMADTSASYQGVQFYRYGGGGGPAPHPRPFTEQQMMANGGFVDNGQMFIARESGPELVGTMGNRTAVANNAQIVAGIAAGVSEANEDVVNAIYTSINQVIGAIRENRNGNGTVDWDAVTRKISSTQRRQAASAFM